MRKQFFMRKLSLLLCLGLLSSCSSNNLTPAPTPEPSVIVKNIQNGGFEDGIDGWTIDGDANAVQIVDGGCEGFSALRCNFESQGNVSIEQAVSGIDDGIYDLEFYYKNTGGQTACYVSAGSDSDNMKMTSLRVSSDSWRRSYVRGINITGNECIIKIISQTGTSAWNMIDGIRLIKSEREFTLLKGGDISELSYVEQNGGIYYENGQEKDCIEILKDNGFNIVRLRLYNDPGNPDYTPSNRLPSGIQDENDVLRLAKRAKEAGMQIQLTFHYSDYWTNAENQIKPHDWEALSFEELKKALYDFTYDFMCKMKEQGTSPEFVSLGNETQSGMLYPDGGFENMSQLAELYNVGYDAVKAVAPESRIIIHLNDAGSKDLYNWYFGELNNRNVKYDIIGASYYPFWTNRSAKEMREWADYIINKFDKDIMIMETGYSWNKTLPDGTPGQLSHNGPYEDFSPKGQKEFILELIDEIKLAKDCRIIGFLYWDPIFIEANGIGWELGGANVVSNTTLFDFNGNRLEVFDAFKYNN